MEHIRLVPAPWDRRQGKPMGENQCKTTANKA